MDEQGKPTGLFYFMLAIGVIGLLGFVIVAAGGGS